MITSITSIAILLLPVLLLMIWGEGEQLDRLPEESRIARVSTAVGFRV